MKNLLKKAKWILYMQLLFTAIAFIVMAVLSYVFMSTIVRGSLVRNANSVLGFVERQGNMDLLEAQSVLNNFSETIRGMILRGDSADMLREYISEISYYAGQIGKSTIDNKGFYGYFETLPGGPVLIYSDHWNPQGAYTPDGFPWYHLAIAANGAIVETIPHISSTGETLFTYAKSVLDDNGRRLGVICIDLQIDVIGQEIVRTALDQGGYGMLINQDMLILSHPNTDFVGRYIYDPVVPLSKFSNDLLKGDDVTERPMVSYRGEDSVVFFHKLSNGWFLGLVTPKSQYYQSLTSMGVVLSLLGATLAMVLIAILVRIDSARVRSGEESKQKSAFLANMSHEIRTPINAIVGMTAIGKFSASIERKDYCFTKIESASKHLLSVINDILDISKIEANKIELSPTDFDFEKMLQQVVNVVNFRVEEKHQKLIVRVDKDIPKFLFADDHRFAQVITNLLSNSVKFTPENGSVTLKAVLLGEENGVCEIKITVTDTGIGISPQQQEKLFQSFQQAESSTARRYGGTGLGLAISKGIIELMGGRVWIESELDKGSTFAFIIKAKRGECPDVNHISYDINWANIRILVVDDDPDILTYFKEVVASLGSHCDIAGGAEEALRVIEQNGAYNIYFIDLKMPGVDGIGLTREIRSREENSGTSVVIMISSGDLSVVEDEAKKAGVNRFLLKPLFPSSIADVISDCIGVVKTKMEEASRDINGIFAGKHVLLAEDIEINREIVLTLLEPTLLKIDCAENGLEAVRMFREKPEEYDLIFMDVQMPEMDGYEASRQIRALDIPKARTIPIVAMTANVFKEDIEKCLASGMDDHLGKPIDTNDLLETTLKYLEKGSV